MRQTFLKSADWERSLSVMAARKGSRLRQKTEIGCIILEKLSILWISRQIRLDKDDEKTVFGT